MTPVHLVLRTVRRGLESVAEQIFFCNEICNLDDVVMKEMFFLVRFYHHGSEDAELDPNFGR